MVTKTTQQNLHFLYLVQLNVKGLHLCQENVNYDILSVFMGKLSSSYINVLMIITRSPIIKSYA